MPGSSEAAWDELGVLRAEIVDLRRRIQLLEAERDEYAQHNAELFVLQQVLSTMNSTLEIDDILSTVLRGITEALRFGRVVLFDVVNGIASRRLETDALGGVVASPNPHDLAVTPTFAAMIAGTSDFALGTAEDPENPLADGRGTYCMLPLISRNAVRGILYVDEPPVARITEAQLRVLLDFAAQAAIAIENARLHGETRRLLEETQRLASTDPLTALYNRRALSDLLERELSNAERYEAPLAFLILDLDDLKRINDTRGHAAGDEALKNFANVLRATARKGDILARYAGDEFVIAMSQTDRDAAEQALRRIFETFRAAGVACSVGVAMFPYDGSDAAALFAAADHALYEAKQRGKDTYVFSAGGRRGGNQNPHVS
ncbi:MAG: diguanylate cyclase domain-containing protein [Candidatus Velthaea sp.]